MKNKKVKRALALLLACTIVIGSVYNTRQKTYASASAIIAGGGAAVVGIEAAITYLLAILGITGAAEVYANRDKIKDWGAEQWGNFKQWLKDNKDKLGWVADAAVVEQIIDKWGEKLSKGTLDKSDSTWGAFKEWTGTQYKDIADAANSGEITNPDDVVFDENHFAAIGTYPTWKWIGSRDSVGAAAGPYTQYIQATVTGVHSYLYTYAIFDSYNVYYYAGVLSNDDAATLNCRRYTVFDNPSYQDRDVWNKTKKAAKYTFDGVYYGYSTYYGSLFSHGNTVISNPDAPLGQTCNIEYDMPNFVGCYQNDVSSHERAAYVAFNFMREGVLDPGETVIEISGVGGISGVYDDAGTLDNVDVVGVGEAEDEKETALPWPGDTTLDDLLAGLLSGENTWTDVLDKLGVGVIDRTETGDMVIGNEGVTTKEWEYAGSATGVPDITLPDTATPSKELSNYTFLGLEKIFPFCLPFDMIDFVKVLDAPAQAPHFKWSFPYPTTSGMKTYEIDIDLSPFDSVAELLRDMECLLFIMGLVLVTRSRMIRG